MVDLVLRDNSHSACFKNDAVLGAKGFGKDQAEMGGCPWYTWRGKGDQVGSGMWGPEETDWWK